MNKLLLIFFVILSVILVGTAVVNFELEQYCNDMKSHDYFIWLPKTVSDYFYSDKINLDFRLLGSIKEVNVSILKINGIVRDSKIASLKCGSIDADYTVYMSDWTAVDLATSKTPITTFRNGWKSGSIKIIPKNTELANKLYYADQILKDDNEPVPENIRKTFEKKKSLG